jgi:hypothetical protein
VFEQHTFEIALYCSAYCIKSEIHKPPFGQRISLVLQTVMVGNQQWISIGFACTLGECPARTIRGE